MASEIPASVREEVARRLYREAADLDWDLMSDRTKSQQYRRWIDDPAIGGKLTAHVSQPAARIWLKDGPMKEYDRALEGIGTFAGYTVVRFADVNELMRAAFGSGWRVTPGTLGEKPMHCLAGEGTRHRYVCWGKPGKFRDLIWAALNAAVDSDHRPMAVVSLRDGLDVTGDERERHRAIGEHCGIDVRHIHRRMVGPSVPIEVEIKHGTP